MPHVVPDLADQRRVVGVPGPAPHPDRDPVPGDRHADHDRGQVAAVLPGIAEGAEPRGPAVPRAAARLLAAGGIAGLVAGDGSISLLRLEAGGGRAGKQQVHLKAERLGGPPADLLLQGAADLQQPVHRPAACIIGGRRQPAD